MKKPIFFVLLLTLVLSFTAHAGEGHGEEEKAQPKEKGDKSESKEAGGFVTIAPASIKEGGITVSALVLQSLKDELSAPGEVKLNSYLSSKVVSRIRAQVVARHAKLGEEVKKGQPLLTLSSIEMAEAVEGALVANKEWGRMQALGAGIVSAKKYNEAEITNAKAHAKIMAYGLTSSQVSALYKKGRGCPR